MNTFSGDPEKVGVHFEFFGGGLSMEINAKIYVVADSRELLRDVGKIFISLKG